MLNGAGRIPGFGLLESQNLYQFEEDVEELVVEATDRTRFILLMAPPLNEKMEHYGPYVMNSQTEIMEAMRDYQMGKMGFLVEEF